jgi:hypothetical protein
MKKVLSQRIKVLKHLEKGHTITQRQAARWWACWRLADVIFKLRNEGHKVRTETVRKAGGINYARYSLDKGE